MYQWRGMEKAECQPALSPCPLSSHYEQWGWESWWTRPSSRFCCENPCQGLWVCVGAHVCRVCVFGSEVSLRCPSLPSCWHQVESRSRLPHHHAGCHSISCSYGEGWGSAICSGPMTTTWHVVSGSGNAGPLWRVVSKAVLCIPMVLSLRGMDVAGPIFPVAKLLWVWLWPQWWVSCTSLGTNFGTWEPNHLPMTWASGPCHLGTLSAWEPGRSNGRSLCWCPPACCSRAWLSFTCLVWECTMEGVWEEGWLGHCINFSSNLPVTDVSVHLLPFFLAVSLCA